MNQRIYDVVAVGLGGIGSATAWALSKQGLDVLGIDKYFYSVTINLS